MVKAKSVPKGYKKTEVGVIPEDWEVKRLGEIAEVKGGKRIPKGKKLTSERTPYPYIKVSDMYYGGVDLTEIEYVPIDVYSSIKKYRIFKEDIFISVAGTLGIVGKVPEVLDGANLTENADRITNITCEQNYLLYFLMSSTVQNKIQNEKTVAAQPKLALNRIKNFLIVLPKSRGEQIAIARVLSDVDELIASIEKLIDKKQNIKQGTMQLLLTGKKRLPGFTGEWEVKTLGEIADVRKGQLITERNAIAGSIPVIGGGKQPSYFHNKANRTGRTITISASGAYAGYVSFYATPIFASDCSTIGSSDVYSIELIYFYLHYKQELIYNMQTGGAQPHIYPRDVQSIVINLPPLPEQKAIAQILSDMDAEIEALEKKLQKYKLVKEGMMEKLLTGKVRLV